MRLFIVELKNRSYLLFLLGVCYFLSAFFCGSFIFFERGVSIDNSISVRVSLFAIGAAMMLWTLGWMNEYLYEKKTRKFFSAGYFGLFLAMLVASIWSVIRGTAPKPDSELPLDRFLFLLSYLLETMFVMLLFVNTWLITKQHKMPVSQHYAWGVRYGLMIFLLPMLTNVACHSIIFFHWGTGSRRMMTFLREWDRLVGGLRIAYFMGIFALQIFPLTAAYVFKKKKEVQVFALTYVICMILLFIMTLLRQPLIPG